LEGSCGRGLAMTLELNLGGHPIVREITTATL
jgi:hypothetical protein